MPDHDSKSTRGRVGRASQRPPLAKRLGQHHLRHASSCRPLVDFLRPAGRRVFEIGPGGGVLTRALAAAGGRVAAVELDPHWAFHLRSRLAGDPLGVALAIADASSLAWTRLPEGALVAGNLPYNVATPIVRRVLDAGERLAAAAFLVQLEVARRLTAAAGEADYGALAVVTAARAQAVRLGRVRAAAFRPPPKVDGAFVGLTPRRPPLPPAELAAFDATVHLAFALRRKTLRNALAAAWGREPAEDLLAELGLDARTRAESLGLDEFVALHRAAARAGLAATRAPAAAG